MKYFFISIVSFLMLLFIYWTAYYFLSGYNLTTNQAHLNISVMVKGLNNSEYLNNFVWDDLITKFDNLRINSIDFISNKLDFNRGGAFKILLTSFNYLVRMYNFLLTPFIQGLKVIFNLVDILTKCVNFIIAMLIFTFHPVFI